MMTSMQQAITAPGLTVNYDLGVMSQPSITIGMRPSEFVTPIDYLVTHKTIETIVKLCWTRHDPLAEFETFLSAEVELLISKGFLIKTSNGWSAGCDTQFPCLC